MMRWAVALLALLAIVAVSILLKRTPSAGTQPAAGDPQLIPLWPEGVPGLKSDASEEHLIEGRVSNVHWPSLTYYPPAPGTANGTALIVCPGGSYMRLAVDNEGVGVQRGLTPLGVSVFILKYRLVEYGYPAPLQDVLRAVRLVRSRAAEFGIRPDRIGVFGASAGGHLTGMAATQFDSPDGRTGAVLDGVSARPDFVGLLYPVVTFKPPFAHTGSRQSLLGVQPSDAMVDRLSLETQVTKSTPPVFIVHTAEDKTVPIENSHRFVDALRRAGVSVEAHFYENGPHGFGVRTDLGPASAWPTRFAEWLRAHGWVTGSQ